ncbi:MAG: hypothetical protein JWM54_1316 [Acidobacteriaceae bacterium]|jgi:hypothetical protein|nr:hypothetical protein [Acidobacteriaceae bacterium]
MNLRNFWMTTLLLTLGVSSAQAKKEKFPSAPALTPEQNALIKKAIAAEKLTIKAIQQKSPLVQTYIQNMKGDAKLYAVPVSDQYMLQRVDFGKSFYGKSYSNGEASEANKGMFKGSLAAMGLLSKSLLPGNVRYMPDGFLEMMFIDPSGFDQQHYDFVAVRKAFLGTVRCDVFDVHPKPGLGNGRFTGRIWIDNDSGNVVRFNGTYTGGDMADKADDNDYFHFDSWRQNLQQGIWLPVGVYVEETSKKDKEHPVAFKAHTQIWGYSLKVPTHQSDNESVKIDDVTDQSANSEDVGPLQAQREWISQAEENVLDRLTQAGLLAAPSDFDKILEQVTNNIIIGNNIELAAPVHCRIMLTTPLESIAVGNTIILSKGLVDTLPTEEALASVLSFQLAHIVLGHHIDTKYAFNDRLLFPDESTFERIQMHHTDVDDTDAAKKAVALLDKSIYKDKMPNAGLYFVQLQQREKELNALNTPRLGDSLLNSAGEPWLAAIAKRAPKLDQDKLDQIAALPLGSRLRTDSWDDKVYQLKSPPVPLLNARDKMPFEVTPVYYKLTRFDQTQNAASAEPNAQQPAQPNQASAQPAAQPQQ